MDFAATAWPSYAMPCHIDFSQLRKWKGAKERNDAGHRNPTSQEVNPSHENSTRRLSVGVQAIIEVRLVVEVVYVKAPPIVEVQLGAVTVRTLEKYNCCISQLTLAVCLVAQPNMK